LIKTKADSDPLRNPGSETHAKGGRSGEDTVFHLPLSNGVSWKLVAPASIQLWLGELARVMELPPGPGSSPARRIEFVARAERSAILDRVRDENWRSLALGTAVRVWWHNAVEEAVVEFDTALLDHPEIRVIAMWTALRPLQFYAISAGGGPFHATLAHAEGRGILIAGAAGTGKSTCCRRLPAPWVGLCDDYALVVRRAAGEYMAHPFPTFSEYLSGASVKTWPAQTAVTVRAVFILEQSTNDGVERVAAHEASTLLFDAQKQLLATCWSRLDDAVAQDLRRRLFENACAMAASIPTYRLRATLSGRFWEKIEEVVRPELR